MKICAAKGCENEVVGHATKKYCSPECRNESWQDPRRKPIVEKVCENPDCEKVFQTNTKSRKYCGDKACKEYGKRAKRLRSSGHGYLKTRFSHCDVDEWWSATLSARWLSQSLLPAEKTGEAFA